MIEKEQWSYSKFNLAEACLRLFYNRYVAPPSERLPELYDPLRETGKAVHKCVDNYKDHLKAIGLPQDLSVVSLIVEDYFSTDPEVISTEHYLDTLLVFTDFAKRYRHNTETFYGKEFLTDRALPETDVMVQGYPDHIQQMQDKNGPIIVSKDLKAGYSTSITAANKLQGEIDAWKLLEWFPDLRVGWQVEWPRAGTESPIHEFKKTYSAALEARLRSIIARVDRARASGKWPATPNAACDYCPLAANCRERMVLAELDVIVSDKESAKKAATDLVLLEGAVKQRREQVRRWTSDNGPVPAGTDQEAGFVKKRGGDTIGDIELMVRKLGLSRLVAEGTFESEKDPAAKGFDSDVLIVATGFHIAATEELVRINGDKTKLVGVKKDERLSGIWIPGATKMAFDVYKVEPEEVVE